MIFVWRDRDHTAPRAFPIDPTAELRSPNPVQVQETRKGLHSQIHLLLEAAASLVVKSPHSAHSVGVPNPAGDARVDSFGTRVVVSFSFVFSLVDKRRESETAFCDCAGPSYDTLS
jgi:hypothetical protein